MKFYQQLQKIFKSRTIYHFSITSIGTLVNGLLGLTFYIFVARALGPEVYGVLAIVIATITLLSDTADFGIDTAILRFVAKYRHNDQKYSLKFLKLGLEIKFVAWILILGLGWVLSPFVAEVIFLKPELSQALRFSLIGVGGAMAFSLVAHAIQAWEKFWLWSLLNIAMNGLRLAAISTLIVLGSLNLSSAMIIYILVPFLGFFLSLLFLPNFLTVKNERSAGSELLNFSKWIAFTGILGATAARLDTLISARFLSVAQIGIYAAAVQLSSVITQIVFALATVVAPKLASFDTVSKALSYIKKLQLLTICLFVSGLLMIPGAFWAIPLIYGQNYSSSIGPFIVLFIAQLIFLLSLPTHQAIYYYFSKPEVFGKVAVIQFLVTAIGGWILISNFGLLGAASTVMLNNLIALIIPAVWVIREFKKGEGYEKKDYLGTYPG